MDRLERARVSLEGLSVGDAFGGYYFGDAERRIQERILMSPPWYFTDDSNMALSIYSILRQVGEIDQDRLAASFAEHYDRQRGYGPAMHRLLMRIAAGGSWREEAGALFNGQGSFGNGGAMRVAPLGAYFADDMNQVVEQARRSAEVTHTHPEGIAGATAAAVGTALASQLGESKTTVSRQNFLDRVLPYVPDSEVREKIRHARELAAGCSVRLAVAALGNGSGIAAQDTVPFTLWCAGEMLGNYEEAIWLTASASGDVDTNCAIVGGIVAAYTGAAGIPAEWLKRREALPEWALKDT